MINQTLAEVREIAEMAQELGEAIFLFQISTAVRFVNLFIPEKVYDMVFGEIDYNDYVGLTE
jgi:hypothetical protein